MRLQLLLFLFILLTDSNLIQAQDWQWAKSIGDTTGITIINALGKYNDQNILIAGQSDCRTLQMGTFELKNAGRNDIFIALCDTAGNVIWAKGFGGTSDETASCITSDKEGNIYIAGSFTSLSLSFGSYTLINKGESDGYLAKINKEKNIEWAISFGGSGNDFISGVVTDDEGNVYLTGYTVDYGMSGSKIFTAKVKSDKSIAWQRTASTVSYSVAANGIALDNENNCYVTGSFSTEIIFEGNHKLNTKDWESAVFIVKYNHNGEYLHSAKVNGFTRAAGILYVNGSLYVSGDSINYGIGWGWPLADSKIFLAKTGLDLKPVWLRKAGGIHTFQSLDITKSMSADSQGNIYLTGSFFSPGFKFGSDSLKNIYNKNYYYQQAFIIKYNSLGNEIWGKAIGDSLCDGGTAILAVGNDRLFAAGFYESRNISFFPHVLQNNSRVREVYVHLKPPRFARNSFSFLASLPNLAVETPITPVLKMSVFPNPAGEYLHIKFEKALENQGQFDLYNMSGRLILSGKITPGETILELNTGNIASGMYLIKINNGQSVTTHKIIRK